jgi:hypothetical protein
VIAGVWEDGETFGQSDWVKIILQGRAMAASQYDQAASLLQLGLDQNWTRDHYLEVFTNIPNSGPVGSIRSTLESNAQVDGKLLLKEIVRGLLESLNQKSELLRQAKPAAKVATGP